MGTKVQFEMYFPGPAYYDSAINGSRNLHHETSASNGGQFYDLSLMNSALEIYSLYDKQQMRQTILNHEVTFRHQLLELHRIYKIQRDLMNGVQCETQYENKNMFLSCILDYDSKITPHIKDIHTVDSSLKKGTDMYSSLVPIQNGVRFEECKSYESRSKKLQRRLFDHDIRADNYIDLEDDNVAETKRLSVKHEDTRVWGHDLNDPIKVNEASSSDSIEILDNRSCSKGQIQRLVSSVASNSNIQFPSKEFLQNPQNRRDRGFCLNSLPSENERRQKELSPYNSESEKNSGIRRAIHGGSHPGQYPALVGSLLIEPRKTHEQLKLPSFDPQKRRTLFGVDIFEKPASHTSQFPVLEGSCFGGSSQLTPSYSVLLPYKHGITSPSESNKSWFCLPSTAVSSTLNTEQSKPEQLQGGLHWLRKPLFNAETSKASEVSNKTDIGFFHDHSPSANGIDVSHGIRKIPGVPISDMCPPSKPSSINIDNFKKVGLRYLDINSVPVKSGEQIEGKDLVIDNDLNKCTTSMRHYIDLNMCLTEEDAPSTESSIYIEKISTEIDLEASFVIETKQQSLEAQFKEPFESLQEELVVSQEETVKDAAEAIVAISSEDTICWESQTSPSDSLHWFVDIISSHNGDLQNESGGGPSCEKVVSQKIDYFEFMTLRMTETKEEDHYHKPEAIKTQKFEEEALPKRPRRGQARRGRHRKDFQRDILPGLASLSKHEVTEDLQTIEDIIRTTGGTWQSSLTKKKAARGNTGRGRRRLGASAPIPSTLAICASPIKQDNHSSEKSGVEVSLTGWGKRTRRPPRQRYPNVNPLLVRNRTTGGSYH